MQISNDKYKSNKNIQWIINTIIKSIKFYNRFIQFMLRFKYIFSLNILLIFDNRYI